MSLHNREIGKIGENYSVEYLLKNNYIIVANNFRTEAGELDIIAKKENKLYFFEVKTRIGIAKGKPWEAITPSKLRHIKTTAKYFLLKNDFKEYKLSLAVISIILNPDRNVKEFKIYEIDY